MNTQKLTSKKTHHGHAIKRFRHTLGVKQDVLATELGISQTLVSNYEQKSVIEDDIIEKFAQALNISPELIKELEEDPVTVIVEKNTLEERSAESITAHSSEETNTANPAEQIIALSKEKQTLYERILELQKKKNALLEELLRKKER